MTHIPDFNLIISVLFYAITVCMILFVLFFSVSWYKYISDGGDMRVCVLGEALLFFLVFYFKCSDLISPYKVGSFSMTGALVTRLYLLFSVFFLVNCKVVGLKLTMKSTVLKNYTYIISSSIFLCVITLFTLSIDTGNFNAIMYELPMTDSVSKLISIFDVFETNTIMQNNAIGVITEIVMDVYIVLGIAISLIFDFIEKRRKLIKIETALFFVPFLIELSLRNVPYYHYSNLKTAAIIIYIAIPMIAFTIESANIYYHTLFNVGKLYKKTIIRARKEAGKWSIVTERQAVVLAKALDSDFDGSLISCLPWKPESKDKIFADYVNSLRKSQN